MKTDPPNHRVVIVGSGLAGLACAMKLAEDGLAVDLVSLWSSHSSHSASAASGINACNDIARQQGYSEWAHFDETILGGDFLADQPPVHEMCYWAPKIIDLLTRMGVPFNRTPEGQRALRLIDGSLTARTYHAGATTGRQLLNAFNDQVRRHESAGRIHRYESHEFLRPILTESSCVGIVAQDLRTMQIRAFTADAVVIATGGNGQLFSNTTMSAHCTGAAVSRCYQAGAKLANPEFIQLHSAAPATAIAQGARFWIPAIRENSHWKPHPNPARGPGSIPESERYYFLEELHPQYANLLPRDIATREIIRLCNDGFSAPGANWAYLQPPGALGEPAKIHPAVHCSMGGLWTGFKKDEKTGGLRPADPANLSTNIPGLYAIGECNFAYHGANRLGANGPLSRIFDGLFGGACIKTYCTQYAPGEIPRSLHDAAVKQETDRAQSLLSNEGDENPYLLRQEVAQWMSDHCTAVRHNDKLELTLAQCQEWKHRCGKLKLADTGTWANQNLPYARATRDMIVLAEAILKSALLRDESRGAHYKPAHPDRDDVNFLKATIARFDQASETASISYDPVDTSLIAPRPRTYEK